MSESTDQSTVTAAEYDWDALVPAEAAPIRVSTVAPFDAMSLPAAIRDRLEISLFDFVKGLSEYVAGGHKAENFRSDWKVQAFPNLEMANKFVTLAKKYAKNRPDLATVFPEPTPLAEGEEDSDEKKAAREAVSARREAAIKSAVPSGQITLRCGKPGPYTPPGADKVLHEIAVRYLAKPLEKSDAVNLPGSAKGQNGAK